MDPLWFSSPLWCHALTLAERVALFTGNRGADISIEEIGRRRLDRWQAQPPFSIGSYFTQRLAAHGISQEELLAILGAPVESIHGRLSSAPLWLAELEDAFSYAEDMDADALPDDFAEDDLPLDEEETEDATPDEEMLGFLELVRPLIDQASARLQAGIAELAKRGHRLPFDLDTIEDVLLMNLPEPLLMRLSRTLVLELHVARLQGYLDGDTPKDRFESFIQRLRQPEIAIAILQEYPVLARQLTLCIQQWTEVCLEFLNRLCQDWALIRSHFSPSDDPGVLVELAGGAGDTHRGGRSVMIATFESDFQIVYKPKSLKIDKHFQELLSWLNDKGCEPPLRTIKVLDQGEYGWVEFVAYQTCSTMGELKRFYARHGAYLALLYALNSNDFHYENLIAVGEHPLLIDLETLLQPNFDTFDDTQAEMAAEKLMAESVLQVGLLPARMWSSDDYAGIDISGLGGMAGQLSPDRLPQIADAGTDAMRYIRQRVEIAGDANRPSLNGVEVNATDHVDEIVAGFITMYQFLMKHRDELLAEGGPIERFSHDEIRVLLRPTRTYDQLLSESFHPDLLRDALERDLFLDRLWMAATVRPYLSQVIASEQAELQRGDIPIFTTHPASLELFGIDGESIPGVLHETGMTAVQRRIRQLSDEDLHRQQWFIRASIATLTPGNIPPTTGRYFLADRGRHLSHVRLLACVRIIADRLADSAIYGADDVTWIGLELLDQQNWTIRTLGIDLANGLSGIALFLAYAGAIAGEERYTLLARRALNSMVAQIEALQSEMLEIGAFDGWGGLLYTLTHLGHLWDEQGILYQAKGVVEIMADLVTQDDKFDIGRGSAGAIVTLLALHRGAAYDKALQVAIACADHLLAAAQKTDHGLSWPIPTSGAKPENAFTPGNAGIAWALLELAAESGNDRYVEVAKQAIDFERTLYPLETDKPPTLHEKGVSSLLGFGLARLCLYQHLNDAALCDEIRVAIHSTLATGFGQNHSLYQGDMGSIELLLHASQTLDDEEYRSQSEGMAAMVIDSIERDGWQCGGPDGVELPGLMLGLAGIGYELLRLAKQMPSVLVLAPPVELAPEVNT